MDRIKEADKKLNALKLRDFKAEEIKAIADFQALPPDNVIYDWHKTSAYKTAEQRQIEAKKHVYRLHMSHCAECDKPLKKAVYLTDVVNERFNRVSYSLPACKDHAKEKYSYVWSMCQVCGVLFKSTKSASVCSKYCMGLKYRVKVRPVEITCAVCHEKFTPKRRDAKTCSLKCRVTKSRHTKADSNPLKIPTTSTALN